MPGAGGEPHDDLEFPGDAPPPPLDPAEAAKEAALVAEAVARNRVAAGRGAVVGFLVATLVFFGIAYAFPESERGLSLVVVALSAGAFAALGTWALLRAKAPAFDPGLLPPDAPADAETRRIEARARAHERRTAIAFALGAATFFVTGPAVLLGWSAHLESLNEGLSYWEPRASIGTGRGLFVLAVAAALGALVVALVRPRVDPLAELGGLSAADATRARKAGAPPALSGADLAELRAIAREVRAQQRRDALSHRGAVVVFFVVAPIVAWLGAGLLFATLAGAAAAFGFARLFGHGGAPKLDEPVAMPDRGRDWFRTSLASARTVTLEVPGGLESMLARALHVAENRWALVTSEGALLAEAREDELPLLERLLPFRPRTISVRDGERAPLALSRSGRPFAETWGLAADGAPAGRIETSLFGALVLRDAAGAERYRLRRSWLDRRSWIVLAGGKEVARLEWPSPGFFALRFDRPGLVVGIPEGASAEERVLLLCAGLVLDLDRA